MPFYPDDKLRVELTAVEWNQVKAVLYEGPHRIVAPLLAKMDAQFAMQDRRRATSGTQDRIEDSDDIHQRTG